MRHRAAFTLVEIMIVVMLISLLAAIAIPAFARARANSQRSACVNNLRQIESAKIQWAAEFKKGLGAKPKDSDLFGPNGYLFKKPVCPAGGVYNLGKLKDAPTCNKPDHVLD